MRLGSGRRGGPVGLTGRLAALDTMVALGRDRLPTDLVRDAADVAQRAGARLRLSGEHTVVALAGATGSGKSSLFNAIARAQLSPVGVRRPTTSETQACVIGAEGAAPLLDWLGVSRRHYGDAAEAPDLAGLVLLDLPDHDSTEALHRVEVDRLVGLVDAFVWVLDPQKYADAAVHDGYLRRLAAHRDVTMVVLNQADLLPAAELEECRADLHRLLAEDGLDGVPVLVTSALTAAGVAPLREVLAATVADHRARTDRVGADLTGLAERIAPLVPAAVPEIASGSDHRLTAALAQAAGVHGVLDAVTRAHQRRAGAALGWPPVRWLSRLRPDPLRRLGLGRTADPGRAATGRNPSGPAPTLDAPLARTSLPGASATARAGVDTAVRQVADTASTGLPEPWPGLLRAAARGNAAAVPDALDRAVGGADLGMDHPPRWWRLMGRIQWLLLGLALVGLVWLGALAVLGYLQIDLDAPSLGPFAWPTVLLVGGLLAGVVLRVLCGPFVAVGAARRRRRAEQTLTRRVSAVGQELVLTPLRAELSAYGELADAARRLRAG